MKPVAQTSFGLVDVDRLVCMFFAPGRPAVKGNIVKTRFGYRDTSKGLDFWTKVVRGFARGNMQVDKPEDGLVRVQILFQFVRPKNHFGKRGLNSKGRNSRRPSSRRNGDIDKLSRAILDALSKTPNHPAIVFLDDSQVVELRASKEWASDEPGVGADGAFVTVEAI